MGSPISGLVCAPWLVIDPDCEVSVPDRCHAKLVDGSKLALELTRG